MAGSRNSTGSGRRENGPSSERKEDLTGETGILTTMAITDIIGSIPFRLSLAGGWIDQPFVSRHNPEPPGSMVVISLEPVFPFMERSGFASSTRKTVSAIWKEGLPEKDPAELVRELYRAENRDKAEPSGSQDMAGLIYPGVSRLDYDYRHEDGVFPVHVESMTDSSVARWLESSLHLLPVGPRPDGYNPLGIKNLDGDWIRRLGRSGKACFDAITLRDIRALGAALNECMLCWETILPNTVRHPALKVDLKGILGHYQANYPGAMYSGCGGGYVIAASENEVPGTFTIKVRTS